MDSSVRHIINSLNIDIIYTSDFDKIAYFIPFIDTIVINSNVSIDQQEKALLHELGHACRHKGEYALYKQTFVLHSKMEYEADCFMIDELLKKYIKESNLNPREINRISFLESCNIDSSYEPVVQELINSNK